MSRRIGRRPGSPRAGTAGAVVLLAFLGLPVLVLLIQAVAPQGGVAATLGSAAVREALVVSLATTAASLLLTLLLGTPLAYALAVEALPGGRLLETIVDLPIVLPPSVAGLALLLLLGRRGPLSPILEPLGLDIAFTAVAVVLAQLFVSAPLYVRSVRAGFRGVTRAAIEAAQVDGAGDWALLRRVMLPLAAGGIASGAVLAWVRALGEFGATIMFAGNLEGRTQTLPLLVYSAFEGTGLGEAIATAAILVAVAIVVLLLFRLFDGRPVRSLEPLGDA